MQRHFNVTIFLRRIAVLLVVGLFYISVSGCLIIGNKGGDADMRDRVAILESRLDNLEQVHATKPSPPPPPSQHFEPSDGLVTPVTSPQMAEARAGSRLASR